MAIDAKRWHEVSRSNFEHEQAGLDSLRTLLDPQTTLGVWTNFELVEPSGKHYEVDAMVLTTFGLWIVELKHYTGEIAARELSIYRSKKGSVPYSETSPLIGTNTKCKVLASRLGQTRAFEKARPPFVSPLVFLSHPDVQLLDNSRLNLPFATCKDVAQWLSRPHPAAWAGTFINGQDEARVLAALKELDIRGARQREQRVGDYILGEVLGEGAEYQDYLAHHRADEKKLARIRTFSSQLQRQQREHAERSAKREFQLLSDLRHDGILSPLQLTEFERGPALIYPYYPNATRLDHLITDPNQKVGFNQKLRLWGQIGEALRYAHSHRVYHRTLAPQNVLVNRHDGELQAIVFNWQTAGSTTEASSTFHAADMVHEDVTPYLAPELVDYPQIKDVRSDLFSLGCLGYFLFSLRQPAADYDGLMDVLLEQQSLDLAVAMDDAPEELRELVSALTMINAQERLPSAESFLEQLARVEHAAAPPAPETSETVDPFEASAGQVVLPGWLLEQKLGQGSSAAAFLLRAEDGDERLVLKVALSQASNPLLEGEAQALAALTHAQIVTLRKQLTINGRVALLLTYAGSETLAQRLSREGPLNLELLQRLGEDLLGLVEVLEDQGVFHRDIKPANLALKLYGKAGSLRLFMFDFSLSRAPLDKVLLGTAKYRDPFLSSKRVFDTSAERYSAAATLHEMATGVLPEWGDGVTTPRDPSQELQLATDRFELRLRPRFEAFFAKALAREVNHRFANAYEMRQEWNALFADVKSPAEPDSPLPDQVSADTPLATLTSDARLREAFERLNLTQVDQLLALKLKQPGVLAGFGGQTQSALRDFAARLQTRYSGSLPRPPVLPGQGLEGFLELAVPRNLAQRDTLRAFLGLESQGVWLSPAEALKQARADKKAVQAISKQRGAWAEMESVRELQDRLAELVRSQGGALLVDEAAEALIRWRGALSNDPAVRRVLARAVLRVLMEAETCQTLPRFELHLLGSELLLEEPALKNRLAELGRCADALVAQRPLPAQSRMLGELQALAAAGAGARWTESRLLKLTTAVAQQARLSARQELYPRQMEPLETLRRCRSMLLAGKLSIAGLRERVQRRYPEATPLPEEPERLQQLFNELELLLHWSDKSQTFEAPRSHSVTSQHGSSHRVASGPPDRLVEQLDQAHKRGDAQLLMSRRSSLADAVQILEQRYGLETISLEAALTRALRRQAAEKKVDWKRVLEADAEGPNGKNWRQLQKLLEPTLQQLEATLGQGDTPLLLQHFGLLARFGQLATLQRLMGRSGRAGGRPAIWLLAPYKESSPSIDGHPLPLPPESPRPLVLSATLLHSLAAPTATA